MLITELSSIQFCNPRNAHIDFLNLIPGRIIDNSRLPQSKHGLKLPDCLFCPLSVNSVHRSLRNFRVNFSDRI